MQCSQASCQVVRGLGNSVYLESSTLSQGNYSSVNFLICQIQMMAAEPTVIELSHCHLVAFLGLLDSPNIGVTDTVSYNHP